MGRTLRSVETFPGGLGPEGPVESPYSLRFLPESRFEWTRGDTAESGPCSIDGERVSGMLGSKRYSGFLDAERRLVIWDGVEYQLR